MELWDSVFALLKVLKCSKLKWWHGVKFYSVWFSWLKSCCLNYEYLCVLVCLTDALTHIVYRNMYYMHSHTILVKLLNRVRVKDITKLQSAALLTDTSRWQHVHTCKLCFQLKINSALSPLTYSINEYFANMWANPSEIRRHDRREQPHRESQWLILAPSREPDSFRSIECLQPVLGVWRSLNVRCAGFA